MSENEQPRVRFKELRMMRAADVQPHPQNWRVHPEAQRAAFRSVVDRLGFTGVIIAYEDGDKLVMVDGHLRRDEFPDLEVPVVVLDLTPDEAKAALASNDAVAGLAEVDADHLAALIASAGFSGPASEMLDAILAAERSTLDNLQHLHPNWDNRDHVQGTAMETAGYDLTSVWPRDGDEATAVYPFYGKLPAQQNRNMATQSFTANYSRSPALEMERIVRTYMRPGQQFLEVCAGWFTFSMAAAVWGYKGEGVDLWDTSLDFGRKQLRRIRKHISGSYKVVRGDAMALPYGDDTWDFIYCNPPFFKLERYGDHPNDLASRRTKEAWLNDSGLMMAEMLRVAKPGALIVTVMADYRDNGVLVPLHADWIAEGQRRGLIVHDIVIQTMRSQQVRVWRHHWDALRTVKAHEYVIVFRAPGGNTTHMEVPDGNDDGEGD